MPAATEQRPAAARPPNAAGAAHPAREAQRTPGHGLHRQLRRAGRRAPRRRARGAALLLAMLVVTLVATLASAALWQQWRATEVEAAERQRIQASWILTGALDWARLIIREDARGNRGSGNPDHLGEPWATPLEEAQLSSFLAADRNNSADDLMPAFLSGDMKDAQSRLNFTNLVRRTGGPAGASPGPGAGSATGAGAAAGAGSPAGLAPAASAGVESAPDGAAPGTGGQQRLAVSEADLASFTRLYQLLNLPQAELTAAVDALLATLRLAESEPEPSATPLIPRRFSQLGWLGISEGSLRALRPHVTVLPEPTPLNLNTASAEALSAAIPGLDLAQAQLMVSERARSPFQNLGNVQSRVPGLGEQSLKAPQHDVRTRFFEVRVRMRMDDRVTEETSLIARDQLTVWVRWRERTPPQ